MTQECDLEAARFFMKLERMLNELQDEKEIASHNLHISHVPNIFYISGKKDDGENHVKVFGISDMSCENKENINPNDYV